MKRPHYLDDDACCIWCGFDAAEWWHMERMKPKDEREPQPLCDRAPPKDSPTPGEVEELLRDVRPILRGAGAHEEVARIDAFLAADRETVSNG